MGKRTWMTWVVGLVVLAACPPAQPLRCPVGETRCDGAVAQACDPLGRWQRLLDCDRVSTLTHARFVCAPVVVEDDEVGRVEGHTCLPAGAGAPDAGPAGGGR